MFTGIVEEIGTVRNIKIGQNSAVLTIRAKKVLEGSEQGDSIAVNGICLTVTELFSDAFSADVMHETLNRSSLAKLGVGKKVNLERALAVGGRVGGHIVTGHVDGTGEIIRIRKDDNAIWYTIQAEMDLMRNFVEKGSVAVDGISLTVAACDKNCFSFSAIPHTVNHTVLSERREGDLVNLETDILGKYVRKYMNPGVERHEESKITRDLLANYGF